MDPSTDKTMLDSFSLRRIKNDVLFGDPNHLSTNQSNESPLFSPDSLYGSTIYVPWLCFDVSLRRLSPAHTIQYISLATIFNKRYKLLNLIYENPIILMYKAFDLYRTCDVFIKIVRNTPECVRFLEEERYSIQLLQDQANHKHTTITLKEISFFFSSFESVSFIQIHAFVEDDYYCVVYDSCSTSLSSIVFEFRSGLPLDFVFISSHQIINSIYTLHQHGFFHSNLSMNTFWQNDEFTYQLLMIDFIQYLPYKGNYPQLSSLNDQSLRSLSPEYLFNGEVNEKTDIWGFGCILFELITGIPLFPTNSIHSIFDFFILYFGLPSNEIIQSYKNAPLYFDSYETDHSILYRYHNSSILPQSKSLRQYIYQINKNLLSQSYYDKAKLDFFIDLFESIFVYDPAQRPSAKQIIQLLNSSPLFSSILELPSTILNNYKSYLKSYLLNNSRPPSITPTFTISPEYQEPENSTMKPINYRPLFCSSGRPSGDLPDHSTLKSQRITINDPTIPPPPPPKLRINTEISPFISFSPPPPRTFPRYNIPVSFSLSPPTLYSDCSMHHSDVSKRFTFSNSQPADISIIEDCVIDDTIAAPENEFSVLDTPPSLQHTPTESTKDSFSIPYPISRSTHLSHTPRVSNSINLPTSTPSSITNLTLSSQAYSNFHSSSSPLSRTSITRPMSPQRRYSSDHKKNSFQILRHSNSVNLSDQEHPPSESQHSVLSSSPSPLGGVPHPVNINLDNLQTPETFTAFPPYSLFTTPSNEQS